MVNHAFTNISLDQDHYEYLFKIGMSSIDLEYKWHIFKKHLLHLSRTFFGNFMLQGTIHEKSRLNGLISLFCVNLLNSQNIECFIYKMIFRNNKKTKIKHDRAPNPFRRQSLVFHRYIRCNQLQKSWRLQCISGEHVHHLEVYLHSLLLPC